MGKKYIKIQNFLAWYCVHAFSGSPGGEAVPAPDFGWSSIIMSYVSQAPKRRLRQLLQEVLSTTEMEFVLAGNEAVYNLTVKDTSEYTKANGDFNEMLLRLIEIVKKYDGPL